MEITEAHIKTAKRELKKGKGIPGVAGTLMKKTTENAEYSDLIAIANRAQMELRKEEESGNTDIGTDTNTNTDAKGSTSTDSSSETIDEPEPEIDSLNDTDFGEDGLFETQVVTAGGNTETETNGGSENENADTGSDSTDSPVVPGVDEINDPDREHGASSWKN